MWWNQDFADSLNHLLQICRDGQEGYSQAVEHTKLDWLRDQFHNYITQRSQFAAELANIVAGLGVEPDAGTSVAGVLHRTWIDLRTILTGDTADDAVILDECERGEDAAKEAYEHELEKGLPEHIHRVVQSQYQDIVRAHDLMREMRDAFPR